MEAKQLGFLSGLKQEIMDEANCKQQIIQK